MSVYLSNRWFTGILFLFAIGFIVVAVFELHDVSNKNDPQLTQKQSDNNWLYALISVNATFALMMLFLSLTPVKAGTKSSLVFCVLCIGMIVVCSVRLGRTTTPGKVSAGLQTIFNIIQVVVVVILLLFVGIVDFAWPIYDQMTYAKNTKRGLEEVPRV